MKYYIKTELILNYMKENNLSKQKFCKECNLCAKSLNKILSNTLDIRYPILLKVINQIGVQLDDILLIE